LKAAIECESIDAIRGYTPTHAIAAIVDNNLTSSLLHGNGSAKPGKASPNYGNRIIGHEVIMAYLFCSFEGHQIFGPIS
jgi:hypothetical protein